jgi:acetyl-CoA synthetase
MVSYVVLTFFLCNQLIRLAMTMLACTRIGAVHSVVFAGFSAEALAQRISAAQSQVLITADIGCRGGKTIPLKDIVDDALTKLDCDRIVQHVLVWERFYKGESTTTVTPPYEMKARDVRMDPLVAVQRPYCPPEHMDAEDNLFILYTSGSTGKPKGLLHTTGGYALFAKMTTQITFDLCPGDLFACVADCGWITGEERERNNESVVLVHFLNWLFFPVSFAIYTKIIPPFYHF